MSNMQPFKRAEAFPNYFEIMLHTVPEASRAVFLKKIHQLIEQNLNTIVERLRLYYVNDKGELSTTDYFRELVKRMEQVLNNSPAKDNYKLEVYLSGGVVRSLLAYVYRQLHSNIQALLENELAPRKPSKDKDRLFKEFEHSEKLEEILNRAQFLKTFTLTPEFWLQKLKTEKSTLQNSYVLGVGSDMDILYKLTPTQPQAWDETQLDALGKNIRDAGEAFLNSAATFFNLDNIEETLKDSLLPPGDVKEYHSQTSYSMSQGGCGLDWLALELSPKTNKKLIEPPAELKRKANMSESIMENFIRGHYEYLASQIVESKARRTTSVVRGLRPLFELPHLKIKDETIIAAEMQDMDDLETRDALGRILLPSRTLKQLVKLQRNTPFEGAKNRGTRPDPESSILSTFLRITKKFAPSLNVKINTNLPKYLQSRKPSDKSPITGLYKDELVLVDPELFIAQFTVDGSGLLYHGTPLTAVAAIIRGGFFISDATQGTAFFGSGLYTTMERGFALEFGDCVLPLQIEINNEHRVINLKHMNAQLLARLKKEAIDKGCLDVNELLKIHYKVDVIIHKHILIQNAAIIKPLNMSHLAAAYGLEFKEKYLKSVSVGEDSFHLISDNINLIEAIQFFKFYTNLCLLSVMHETDLLSPVKLINHLVTQVEQIKNTPSQFDLQNTEQFIFANCFLTDPNYVRKQLPLIFKYSKNNPEIITALTKFAKPFALSFKLNGQSDPHNTWPSLLKNIILFSKENHQLIDMLESLQLLETPVLNTLLKQLVAAKELSQAQVHYGVLAASHRGNTRTVQYLWCHLDNLDPAHITEEEQAILNTIFKKSVADNAIDFVTKLFKTFTFDKTLWTEVLYAQAKLDQKEMVLCLLDLIHTKDPENMAAIKDDVFVYSAKIDSMDIVSALLSRYPFHAQILLQALSNASHANHKGMVLCLLDLIKECGSEPQVTSLLDEIFIKAAKEDDLELIQKLLMLYTPTDVVLNQALSLACEARQDNMVFHLLKLMPSLNFKTIETRIVDTILVNATKAHDSHIIDALLTTCEFNDKLFIKALSLAGDAKSIKLLRHILYQMTGLVKNFPQADLEKIIIYALQENALDVISKLSSLCVDMSYPLIQALSAACSVKHSSMVLPLLEFIDQNKVNLLEADPAILARAIRHAIGSEAIIVALLKSCSFDEQIFTQVLKTATEVEAPHPVNLCLLKLINQNKISLHNIEAAILRKIILQAMNQPENFSALLTICAFDETIFNEAFHIASDSNDTLKQNLAVQLFKLINSQDKDLKLLDPLILNKILINAVKSEHGNDLLNALKNLIDTNKIAVELIDNEVLDHLLLTICSNNFYHSDLAVLNKLLSTHAFSGRVLTEAASKARLNGQWGLLFDSFLENKADLKTIDPQIFESSLQVEAESRYPDIEYVSKLLKAFPFHSQALTKALSAAYYRDNYQLFVLILDKVDANNLEPTILDRLKRLVQDAPNYSAGQYYVDSLLTHYQFHEKLLHPALAAASHSDHYAMVLKLLDLIKDKIDLKNTNLAILSGAIETAIAYSDFNFIDSILSVCDYNEQIVSTSLLEASDANRPELVCRLLESIDAAPLRPAIPEQVRHKLFCSRDPAILNQLFTNAVRNDSVALTTTLLERYTFADDFLQETLAKKLKLMDAVWIFNINDSEDIMLSILKTFKSNASKDPLFHGTLLEFACRIKMEKIALYLLEKKPDLKQPNFAFLYACENGLKSVVIEMIEQKVNLNQIFVVYEQVGCDFFSKEKVQKTPLIAALRARQPEIALLLIQRGAENVSVPFSYDNALEIAIRKNYLEVANAINNKVETPPNSNPVRFNF